MKFRLQIAAECVLALGISAAMVSPCLAQRGRANWAAQRQAPPPRQAPPRPQPQRQQQRPPQPQRQAPPRQNPGANRPAGGNPNRAPNNVPNRPAVTPPPQSNGNPNRPPSAYTPPPKPQKNFNELSPQEKQKILGNDKRYQNLSPAQKQQMNEAARNWGKMTPQQQNHIKNDVLPKWRQLPPDRQRAIQQRLGVLKNMPESARNQHLNDPNFTRGMSEEDKSMLQDLSHMHVGGAPEPPNE